MKKFKRLHKFKSLERDDLTKRAIIHTKSRCYDTPFTGLEYRFSTNVYNPQLSVGGGGTLGSEVRLKVENSK